MENASEIIASSSIEDTLVPMPIPPAPSEQRTSLLATTAPGFRMMSYKMVHTAHASTSEKPGEDLLNRCRSRRRSILIVWLVLDEEMVPVRVTETLFFTAPSTSGLVTAYKASLPLRSLHEKVLADSETWHSSTIVSSSSVFCWQRRMLSWRERGTRRQDLIFSLPPYTWTSIISVSTEMQRSRYRRGNATTCESSRSRPDPRLALLQDSFESSLGLS